MKYDLEDCIGLRLRRLSRITDGCMRSCVADFGISENQMTILFVLTKEGQVEQGKIGQKLALQRSTVTRNIQLLEKQELVERTADYRPEVSLTEKGRDLVRSIIPLWEKAMDDLLQTIKPEGLSAISKLEDSLL